MHDENGYLIGPRLKSAFAHCKKPTGSPHFRNPGKPTQGLLSFWGGLYWIASEGGRLAIDIADSETILEPAFRVLLSTITEQRVALFGRGRGLNEQINGTSVIGVRMVLWNDPPSDDRAPFIQLAPVPADCDEEYWQLDFNDQLFVGNLLQYSHLVLSAADILSTWSFEVAAAPSLDIKSTSAVSKGGRPEVYNWAALVPCLNLMCMRAVISNRIPILLDGASAT